MSENDYDGAMASKRSSMHLHEREAFILDAVKGRGFISFQDLESQMSASPATIRRDLERLMSAGLLERVRGGARRPGLDLRTSGSVASSDAGAHLEGVPFTENIHRNIAQKAAIGRAAARLCAAREAVMIDGGTTTLQMCQHLAGLDLQVLTNSLSIANSLLGLHGTRVLVPAGQVFPEQNIILSLTNDDGMPLFHAPKLFMSGAAMGPAGLMQLDMLLVAAERRFIERAEQLIVLLDSSKFHGRSGHVVCRLDEIDVVVTDKGASKDQLALLERADIRVIVAD